MIITAHVGMLLKLPFCAAYSLPKASNVSELVTHHQAEKILKGH